MMIHWKSPLRMALSPSTVLLLILIKWVSLYFIDVS